MTKSLTKSRKEKEELAAWAKSEAYFFNHGANIATMAFLISFNVAMATWGAWEFTANPKRTIANELLKITLPMARASGRLVTWNFALLLLSACKYFWTLLRKSPIALGFPINNVMPYYHKILAQTIIVMGCVCECGSRNVDDSYVYSFRFETDSKTLCSNIIFYITFMIPTYSSLHPADFKLRHKHFEN